MAEGFDLRDQPWVPVRIGGCSQRVGLRELFLRAHEVEDLELPVPPAASGLLRILSAMTTRIAGEGATRLDEPDLAGKSPAWRRLRNRVLEQGRFDPDRVREYFDREVPAGRFDLFGPVRPFLQDPRLVKECVDARGYPNPSGVNKLVLGRPTGVNGAVLFGHFTDGEPVALPAAEAAWHLIAQLYYGPSGQCTPRRITSVRAGSGDAGPLRKTVSYFPWADSLFATLVLAVPAPQGDPELGGKTCPWEEELPDPGKPVVATWPARLLTGRARHAVLLVPDADRRQVVDAYLTWSTHTDPDKALDPFVIGDVPARGGAPYARPADGARATWRDLDSLLMETGTVEGKRPVVFEKLPRKHRGDLRVRAYGFDQDGQQKDTVWYEATTTPPVLRWQQPDAEDGHSQEASFAEEMAVRVRDCHDVAEKVGQSLEYAAMLAWALTSTGGNDPDAPVKVERKRPGPWAARALRTYWPQAEHEFWQLMRSEHRSAPVHKPFVTAALDALDAAIGTSTRADVRVARARARSRRVLFKLLPATGRGELPTSA